MQARGGGTDAPPSMLFEYTVRVGDTSPGLRCANESVLSPVGGIRDLAGNAADLGLPAPGPLHGTGGIVIYTSAPRVANVTSDTRTASTARERVSPSLSTSTSSCVARATRRAELNASGSSMAAAYASGDGTLSFVFGYTWCPATAPTTWSSCRGALSGDIAGASGSAANRTLPPLGSPLAVWIVRVAPGRLALLAAVRPTTQARIGIVIARVPVHDAARARRWSSYIAHFLPHAGCYCTEPAPVPREGPRL